jgi:hypothetical protein
MESESFVFLLAAVKDLFHMTTFPRTHPAETYIDLLAQAAAKGIHDPTEKRAAEVIMQKLSVFVTNAPAFCDCIEILLHDIIAHTPLGNFKTFPVRGAV